MKSLSSQLLQTTKIVTLAIILTLILSTVSADPTAYPPAGNVDAPINVGTSAQIKQGGLGVNALSVFGGSNFKDSVVFEKVKSCSKIKTTFDGTLACND